MMNPCTLVKLLNVYSQGSYMGAVKRTYLEDSMHRVVHIIWLKLGACLE